MKAKPTTILLIEDNAADVRLVREALNDIAARWSSGSRYDLICVDRLATGLARLVNGGIDVVLLDLTLPDSDGMSTLVKVCTEAPSIPVVVMTVRDDESWDIQAMQSGAQDYLIKGQMNGSSLVRAMRYAIERKRGEQERAELVQERAARLAAEAANRAKDEFLAMVSHELRTPLTSMLGWARIMRINNLDPSTSARGLETIERNAKAQAQLVEDLLDISRVVSGKLRLDVCPVELGPVIEAAIETIRPAAEAKSIRLQVTLDPKAGSVTGDSGRLQQIVWNLISNAVKFTPKGGSVQVRLERINSHLEIVVSDSGQGISPAFLPYIFDSFRQADASNTRHHGGLGLGLAIVRHLVELHGGTVYAHSDGDGQGAIFQVQLPFRAVMPGSASVERVHPATDGAASIEIKASLQGVRVLLVDDEPDTRELLLLVFTKCGAEPLAVESAAGALEALEQWRPDLLVSDVGLAGTNGYALIEQVRQLPSERGGRIPAVALTAYARGEDKMRALAAGFDLHIAKPADPAELAAVLSNLMRRTGKRPQPLA